MRRAGRPPSLGILALLAALVAAPSGARSAEAPPGPVPGPAIGDRLSDWVGGPPLAGDDAPARGPRPALPDDWLLLMPTPNAAPGAALPARAPGRPPAWMPAETPPGDAREAPEAPSSRPAATAPGPAPSGTSSAAATAPSPAFAAPDAAAPAVAVAAPSETRARTAPWPADPVAAPFAGSDLFVGRSMPVVTRTGRYEVGIASQVVPLELVLSSNRDALVAQGVSGACASSADPGCEAEARQVADQALAVIQSLPDAQWNGVVAAAQDPAALARVLRTYGVSSTADIQAVQAYVSSLPADRRADAMVLARNLSGGLKAAVRLEPFANLDLKALRVRVGVPFQVGTGTSTAADLGNLTLDAGKGWAFPVRGARLGVAAGLSASLPTSTGSDRPSLMADLFQAPRYVPGYLTLSPYVVAGVDHRWVSLQVHGDLWIQARVRDAEGPAHAEVLQYGLGLTLMPHWYLSLVAQLEGVEGLNAAEAYKALFVVAGLQLNLWYVRLGVALQVPVLDRNQADLGTWQGLEVGALARYSVLSRLSVSF